MQIEGRWIKDSHGRTLMLRGVNLGGSSKMPARPDGATHNRAGFFDHRDVSFAGRPFPLAEADAHFRRLKRWGFTFLRLLTTWEAIEHAGPGKYDQPYLEYLEAVVRKASEHGIRMFIDPHQDVWSRFTGGDGAPGWTLEAAGFDMQAFRATGAAIVHATHGDPFPLMVWPTNGTKLAAATMFTLFFGGNDFAPQTLVDGEPIQSYLQRHYTHAIVEVAKRLKGIDCVVGFDSLNEPLPGWIGWKDLTKPGGLLRLGLTPSPFQAMLLGAGHPQNVEKHAITWRGMRKIGTRTLNQERASAWLPGRNCIWRENEVWREGPHGPELLRPDHFSVVRGKEVHFNNDYFKPFARQYFEEIRKVNPNAVLFLETEAAQPPPRWSNPRNIVFAPHWYDAVLLITKQYTSWAAVDYLTERLVFGKRKIRQTFAGQIEKLVESAEREMGPVPVLIGEFGIPFDLNGRKAYRTGNYEPQCNALDRSFRAVEDNLLHCTLWNYTADNTHARGDGWNGEDLSIFSADDYKGQPNDDSGGRALEAAVRPYPVATAGKPLAIHYAWRKKKFVYRFQPDPGIQAPTEIFIPMHFAKPYLIEASPGRIELAEADCLLRYFADPGVKVAKITIKGR